MVETKLNKNKITKINEIPNYKTTGHPTQKIKLRETSNGMLSIIKKSDCNRIKNYYESMDNKYIIKHIMNKFKIIIISVYMPPYESENQYYTDPNRMEIIDNIYKDLSTLINFAKMINHRIILFGDFNARIGAMIHDHNTNIMGLNKFLPFINQHDLKIINLIDNKGIATCLKQDGSSIVDYVITDNHEFWDNEIYQIKLIINDIKFRCKKDRFSDHKPLLIKLKINTNKLSKIYKNISNTNI